MKFAFTWTGDWVTTETWSYDRGLGAGFEVLTGGTFTHTYSAGVWTTTTSA